MVLINGVKYACERCIRGHRVTTCTHTDQPLTMIKPKGRPATQCHHCREQRKTRNLHTLCTCGVKGKSPGMHFALCQCYKNSHCTCSSNASKKNDTKKKLQKSMSELSIQKDTGAGAGGGVGSVGPTGSIPPNGSSLDEMQPFEMGNGLFDMFSPSSDNFSSTLLTGSGANGGLNNSARAPTRLVSVSASGSVESSSPGFPINLSTNATTITNNNDKTNDISGNDEINMVGNMFPLFPLVGTSSFSDNKDQPLSPLPDHFKAKLDQSIASSVRQTPDNSENVNAAMLHYQQIRPKRPESSLSIASNSSTASRPNINLDNLNYQNIPATSAYPPNSQNFSDDGVNQNDDQLNSNSLFNDLYESRFSQYEQFINSITQQDKGEIPSTNLQFGETENQSQRNMDLELHPMFSELMLPMKYDSKNDK